MDKYLFKTLDVLMIPGREFWAAIEALSPGYQFQLFDPELTDPLIPDILDNE